MGIKSEPFRGVVLSGKRDIERFERQIRRTKPTQAAVATVARGGKLVAEFQSKGYATFTAKGPTKTE